MPAHYDQIGKTYTSTRAADARIVDRLVSLLSLPAGAKLVDVGAGTGNYSRALAEKGLIVDAVEPSPVMRAQGQSHENLNWVAGSAEEIPFPDSTFDGAVMTLCLHHLQNWQQGIKEALRVSGGGPLAIFAFDIEHKSDFWLFEYFPEFAQVDESLRPTMRELKEFVSTELKARITMEPYPLPKDLVDHFAAADWARPENYLDEKYRKGISTFYKLSADCLADGLRDLQADMENGNWNKKYGHLLERDCYDNGYLFIKILQQVNHPD